MAADGGGSPGHVRAVRPLVEFGIDLGSCPVGANSVSRSRANSRRAARRRCYGRAPFREHIDRADQHDRDIQRDDREVRYQGFCGLRQGGAQSFVRHGRGGRRRQFWDGRCGLDGHLDSRYIRLRHHRLLHRRHPPAGFTKPPHSRHRPHRSATRAARYLVRCILDGRHGPCHHEAAGRGHIQRHSSRTGLRFVAWRRARR